MKTLRIMFGLGLLVGLGLEIPALPTPAQTTTSIDAQPLAPGLRELTGDDVKRAEELDKAIAAALKADRWDEAIAKADELLAMHARIQGPKHFKTVNAEWRVKALRRVSAMSNEDRVAYQSANTLYDQADPLSAQGKYAQAQSLHEQALAIRRRLLTDDHPDTANSYNDVALILNYQGKYALAQPMFEKGLEIFRHLLGDDHPDSATGYNNVAYNLTVQGKYAQAQPLLEKALEVFRRVLGDNHTHTASSYNNLAGNLHFQGKYAEAQPLFEKALEINRRLLTDENPDTAISYNNFARNLNFQGKYAQAQPLFQKALDIFRRQLTDDHPDTARSYNNLAANLDAQEEYTLAQPLYEKALEIRRRLLSDHHPDTAESYNNLARNLNFQGKYSQAEPLLEKALEINRSVITDDHPGTAETYNNLAVNLNALGKYAEARRQWLSAVNSLDKARLRVAFSGLERVGATSESPRPALAAVLARLGQPALAWQPLEEDLGRGLLDELAARQDQRLARPERTRLRELTAALERLDKLVETTPKELDKTERARRFDDLKRQRELASIALGEFQTKLVRDHGPLAGQVATLNEIQAALPADLALIAWVDISPAGPNAADPDGEHWGVVVRSRGIPAWVSIAGTGNDGLWTREDAGLADRLRAALRRRPGNDATDLRSLIKDLRAQRLEPLEKALGATADGQPPAPRLIVLPSRTMAGIPVESVLAEDDTRTVSYSPSATVFKYLREQPRLDRRAGLLALGDPNYDRTGNSSEAKLTPDHKVLAAARGGDDDFAPLPGTRYEVLAIARLFEAERRAARIMLGTDASEQNLDHLATSGELGRFGFIHLATHAVIDEQFPLRSAVILNQTGLPDPLDQVLQHRPAFDGRLSVREIQRGWELKAELVTLSACESALGREAGGEGFVGFTQALLMSGTRSVCLSLWKVDDTATALLMQRFYANLLGRRHGLNAAMPKAEALREAKTWLRGLSRAGVLALTAELSGGVERGKGAKARPPAELAVVVPAGGDDDRPYESPHFWAAFVLAGDPD